MKNLSSIQISADHLSLITELIKSPTKRKYCPVVKIVRDYNYSIPGWIQATIYNLNKMVDYIPMSYTMELGNFIVYNLQQTGKFAINLLYFIVFIIHTH